MKNEKRPFKLMPEPAAMFGGVCSGLAYWSEMPVWLIRATFAISTFAFGFTPVILYVILYVISEVWDKIPDDYTDVVE